MKMNCECILIQDIQEDSLWNKTNVLLVFEIIINSFPTPRQLFAIHLKHSNL